MLVFFIFLIQFNIQVQALNSGAPTLILNERNKILQEIKKTARTSKILIQKVYQEKNAKSLDVKKLQQIQLDLITLSEMADQITNH